MRFQYKKKSMLSILKPIGFTLVEVLIAMSILATLSMLTAQSISRSIRDKSRIQTNIDHSSSIQTAFKIIERDIQMIFHFRDIHYEVTKKLANQKNQKAAGTGQSGTSIVVNSQAPGAINKIPETTEFVGDENKIDFVTLLQGRGYGKGLEGDLKEIGYYLEQCRSYANPKKSSDCLWRRISSVVDDDVERGGASRVLLENIKSLQFQFYNSKTKTWIRRWNSKTQKTFPEAVEVTLETNPDKRSLKLQSIIPIRHPNNF